MGWERGRYYTRSRKVNGRVVREYVGAGLVGILAAQLDAEHRELRALKRAEVRAARDELDALDEPLEQLNALADRLVRVALLVAGYQQHKRGEWRKKRGRE
jgi:multidrug efflux pump subunit AcrA (membrane-fusion protein)